VGGSGKKQVTITAQSYTLTSNDFKLLSNQPNISNGGTPASWVNPQGTTINLFFVNKLNPPAALGGTLYGFAWLCNNGAAIAASTFASPARPDTIAHELMHTLCLDHGTYGAGPYNVWNATTNPNGGILPETPGTQLPGQCNGYSACGANLMTTGSLRTEPTLACILNGITLDGSQVTTPNCSGLPSLYNGMADQVAVQVTTTSSALSPNFASAFPSAMPATTAQLPVPQQAEVLGLSGLLFNNTPFPPGFQFSGLVNPIPQETTKAELGTDGSSTDRAIFDLSGPAGGRPAETLLAWVLTLPQEQSFGRHDGFHIVSQSRKDLVEDVRHYPGPGNNPLKRNIAYQTGGDNNADDPSIAAAGPSPCAFATAECLVVKFQPPGLGADDSISFSNSILSGDAPITNSDLCKAKITYVFSDGFVTTSNFGRCPPVSLPLIASSWHPDRYVAPHVVQSNLLLADGGSSLGCTPVDGVCPPLDQSPLSDADVTKEAGNQPLQSCDGGATLNNPVTGIISGPNVIITGGQTCHYQDCEFLGSLTINNATAYLKNCTVIGQLTANSGTLYLLPPDPPSTTSVTVGGNIQIGSNAGLPNSFSIGPGTNGHNLTIQYLPSGGLGYVCGSTFVGGVSVNNNASTIDIGQSTIQGAPTCAGNHISGGLSCKSNMATPIGGGNGGGSGQCANF
jgi:hypothetical protein